MQSFHEWLFVTCDWRISSGMMKGKRYNFDAFPCQLDMIRDDSRRQAIMKSAQMAVSEHYTLARPFYALDVLGTNWGVLFPTQNAMRNFFKTRIKAAVAANPYLARHTTAENESNIDAFDRSIYLRYTTTETAIATFDADGITVDEQDFHNADALYGAKTSRSQGSMKETYWFDVSTPSYPKFGIHQAYLDSDQHIWLIRCPGCSYENDLTKKVGEWDLSNIERFFREYLTALGDWRDYHIPCSGCMKPLDTVSRFDPNNPSFGGGRWVSRHPDRDTRGYHLQIFQRLYEHGAPQVLQRVRRSLLDATKPSHVKRWWNYTLGVPFVPSEGRLSDEDLEKASTGQYDNQWTRDPVYTNILRIQGMSADWMGVDVRDGQYHVFTLKRLSDHRFLVVCVGWVKSTGEVRDLWERLGSPIFVIDAAPDTNESRALCRGMGRRACRGRFGSGGRLWQDSVDEDTKAVNRAIVMETVKAQVESLTWIFPRAAWRTGAGILQKVGENEVEETLSDHFKAPVMIRTYKEKVANEEYDFPRDAMGGCDPHFFMAACLAHVATEIQAAPAIVVVVPR